MTPLHLGSFAVDHDGLLHPRSPGNRPALRFAWRGRTCTAELDGAALRLHSLAARVPSSAEPGADRARAFAALSALPQDLPAGWQLQLLPDHRVRLTAEAPLSRPPTTTQLITAMVRFGLTLDPCLDHLEQAGLR